MDDETWLPLADAQQGLLTRRQLAEHGVTRDQLRWRLGRSWQLVLPRVVDVRDAAMPGSRQLVAAMLEAGDDAVLTGHRACLWHGLASARGNRPVVALVGETRASRSCGFLRVVRTRRPVLEPVVGGSLLRIAPLARAVVDAARVAVSADEACALVIEAVQRGLVTTARLEHELEAGPRRGSRWTREAVAMARAGAWSVPEADLLKLCASSKVLPHVWPNPRLQLADGTRLTSPDAWVDDVALAIMVHSRAHHLRDADWEATVEQDARLQAAGVTVLGLTPASIAREPARVLRMIEQTYRGALASGRQRPDVRMTPRGWGLTRS